MVANLTLSLDIPILSNGLLVFAIGANKKVTVVVRKSIVSYYIRLIKKFLVNNFL
jgi:hypothetical protein